jgi:hypothetical protein
MKPKTIEFRLRHLREGHPVRIVADAAISTRGQHGGRLLPLLILDTKDRPDIVELIRLHEAFGAGDVKVQWGKVEAVGHEETVALFLTFIRPAELFMILEFDIAGQGFLVEQILIGQGVYLANAERANDRLGKNLDRPRILVEVGDTGFKDAWDDKFYKHVAKDFRSRGLSRAQSRQAARSVIDEWRKFSGLKMRDIHE